MINTEEGQVIIEEGTFNKEKENRVHTISAEDPL